MDRIISLAPNILDDAMNTIDVFLSYSHKDNYYRERVQKALEQHGLSVWVDDRGIPPGVDWQEAIQDAIDSACCVVVILSPDAKNSRYINRELSYADDRGKRIFPILARGKPGSSVPFAVSGIQFVSIAKVSQAKFELVMESLARTIRAHHDAGCPPI
jgi:hypothetical protein